MDSSLNCDRNLLWYDPTQSKGDSVSYRTLLIDLAHRCSGGLCRFATPFRDPFTV